MRKSREAGILLHITSLPGKYGIGTIGSEAYKFIDFLHKAGLKLWQILPLSPTSYGDSPYQSISSNALNYYLIDLDLLIEEGLLKKEYCDSLNFGGNTRVDYECLFDSKIKVLKQAFVNFDIEDIAFKDFVKTKKYNDFALFMTLKEKFEHKQWTLWPLEYQKYSLELEQRVIEENKSTYLFWIFTQYIFEKQWHKLKEYAHGKNVEFIGDIPLYIAYDSVEVWKYPKMFDLDSNNRMINVAGCPPDAFSDDGQLWGNPVYNWEEMKKDHYQWWLNRINQALEFVDVLRIDHFRGFDRFYAIPASHTNARQGHWVDGPKFALFKDITNLSIIAEDLGVIDDGVRNLLKETTYPGMKILEFAFDGNSDNEHKPSNYTKNYVCYTGTHDNLPLWQYYVDLSKEAQTIFKCDLREEMHKLNIDATLDTPEDVVWAVIKLAYHSVANSVVIPMQDLLCQDGTTRMNLPSTVSKDNWSYRISKQDLSQNLCEKLAKLVKESYR